MVPAWTLVELIDALKKLMLHFFPLFSLYLSTSIVLDEIHAAQTDCFADDYIRNFNKAQREGSFLSFYIILLIK